MCLCVGSLSVKLSGIALTPTFSVASGLNGVVVKSAQKDAHSLLTRCFLLKSENQYCHNYNKSARTSIVLLPFINFKLKKFLSTWTYTPPPFCNVWLHS